MTELNRIYNEDCLEGMKDIPDGSVDMILCDLPYGTTQNKWDSIIPLGELWEQYNRIIKDDGAMVFTGQGLFSANLIKSNEQYFRYALIWEKTKAGGFLNAKRMPLQAHEDMLVFYKKLPTYNPQMIEGKPYTKKSVTNGDGKNYGKFDRVGAININSGTRYPRSVIKVSNDNHGSLHPTQKPVALFEYLIKTYTNEGETVLDNCIGSGTTAIACINTNRNYIGFELDKHYCDIANERVQKVMQDKAVTP
jgi:site-specific DNA-methyltransferase (adenine-specific)